MDIHCHCAACGTDFSVGKEFAGRHVRCVECGGKVDVPAVQQSRPVLIAAEIDSSPEPEQPLAEIIGLDSEAAGGHKPAYKLRPTAGYKRAKGWQGWQIAALVGGGLLAVLGLVLVLAWDHSPAKAPAPPPTPPPKPALLAIELPEEERSGATISIDEGQGPQRKELPHSGPIQYTLAAGKCRVLMDRPHYHAEDSVVLKSGETRSYRPLWVRTSFEPPAKYTDPQENPGGGDLPPQDPSEVQ
jgi:hypothetical protein